MSQVRQVTGNSLFIKNYQKLNKIIWALLTFMKNDHWWVLWYLELAEFSKRGGIRLKAKA
jgi:hypothetical protein